MDWTANRIEVDGVMLDCACYGPPPDQAPTIVMLHEGLGATALWRDVPAQVAQATGLGVFVYSRQGHGQSDPAPLPRPLDFMTIEATQVLPKVLDAIGARQTILLGHSDGATIAAIYAGSVEDFRVRGLILIAPHFFTEPGGLAEIARARDAYQSGDLRDRMAKYHTDPDATFRAWNDVWLDPGFANWDVTEVIDYLRIPTLAIQGRDDQYGTLAQINVIADRSYAPVDLEVIDNCQHAPHLEQPAQTLSLIADYTARLMRIEAAQPEPA